MNKIKIILFIYLLNFIACDMKGYPNKEEAKILDTFENPFATEEVIDSYIGLLPERLFKSPTVWIALANDVELDAWKRMEAYKVLLGQCVDYPCKYDLFMDQIISPLNREGNPILNMSKAQYLPLDRIGQEKIYMLNLPLQTESGPLSVYFTFSEKSKKVNKAIIYPNELDQDN